VFVTLPVMNWASNNSDSKYEAEKDSKTSTAHSAGRRSADGRVRSASITATATRSSCSWHRYVSRTRRVAPATREKAETSPSTHC
jgi:hypothetical protein